MESLIILQAVTVDQIVSKIENIIERKLNEKIAQLNPSKKWRYISRKEVAELLKISLPVKEIKYARNFNNSPTLQRLRSKNN